MKILNYRTKRVYNKLMKLLHNPSNIYREGKARFMYLISPLLNYRSDSLLSITLIPTTDCTFDCIMCSFKGQRKKEMDSDPQKKLLYFKNIIDEVKLYQPDVIITGGEPLLYPYIGELLKYIKLQGLNINLQTNGAFLTENIIEVLLKYVDELNISVDGHNEEIYEKVRKNKLFNNIIEKIIKLDKIKKERQANSPLINICYTICDENYLYLEEMVNFINNLKVKVKNLVFQHLMFLDKELILKNDMFEKSSWEGFTYKLENFDIDKFLEKISRVKTFFAPFNILFFPDFLDAEIIRHYKGDINIERFKRCLFPYTGLYVFPNLKVEICPGYKIGNIEKEKFRDIWNNDKVRFLRKKVWGKKFEVCRACCDLYTR